MLCKNENCRAQIHSHHWGEGYCSAACMKSASGYRPETDAPLMHPDNPNIEIAANRDEIDAMLACAEIDPLLPKMIYFRKQGKTLREIGGAMRPRMHPQQCDRILKSVTRNMLKACGL